MERRELVEYGDKSRTISLTPEVVKLLIEEHARHPSSPLMFMHPATQKPYSPQMVRRLHSEIIREAGLDHIRFEDLRHTCAVLSLQNGVGVEEVAQMLGHFRAAMTRQNYEDYLTYGTSQRMDKSGKTTEKELQQAADLLDGLLKF